MKIVYFSDAFDPYLSGVVVSIINSSRELVARGHDVYLFTSTFGDKKHPYTTSYGLKVIPLRSSGNIAKYPGFQTIQLSAFNQCRKHIKNIMPDVLHVHTPTVVGLFALIFRKLYKIPLVNTYHTYVRNALDHLPIVGYFNRKLVENLSDKYTKFIYSNCEAAIAPSQCIKNELERTGINKNIHVISNGVDLSKFRNHIEEKPANNGANFIHVGRIAFEKSIDVVVRAFKILATRQSDARLHIVGDGPDLVSLQNLAKEIGLQNKVIFHGHVSHEKLGQIYNTCDTFITASTMETEGLVILEAMACGLPIIGVDVLAIPNVVKHGANGLIASEGNATELAAHMETMMTDHAMRHSMANESLKIVKQFELSASIKKVEDLYVNLIANHS